MGEGTEERSTANGRPTHAQRKIVPPPAVKPGGRKRQLQKLLREEWGADEKLIEERFERYKKREAERSRRLIEARERKREEEERNKRIRQRELARQKRQHQISSTDHETRKPRIYQTTSKSQPDISGSLPGIIRISAKDIVGAYDKPPNALIYRKFAKAPKKWQAAKVKIITRLPKGEYRESKEEKALAFKIATENNVLRDEGALFRPYGSPTLGNAARLLSSGNPRLNRAAMQSKMVRHVIKTVGATGSVENRKGFFDHLTIDKKGNPIHYNPTLPLSALGSRVKGVIYVGAGYAVTFSLQRVGKKLRYFPVEFSDETIDPLTAISGVKPGLYYEIAIPIPRNPRQRFTIPLHDSSVQPIDGAINVSSTYNRIKWNQDPGDVVFIVSDSYWKRRSRAGYLKNVVAKMVEATSDCIDFYLEDAIKDFIYNLNWQVIKDIVWTIVKERLIPGLSLYESAKDVRQAYRITQLAAGGYGNHSGDINVAARMLASMLVGLLVSVAMKPALVGISAVSGKTIGTLTGKGKTLFRKIHEQQGVVEAKASKVSDPASPSDGTENSGAVNSAKGDGSKAIKKEQTKTTNSGISNKKKQKKKTTSNKGTEADNKATKRSDESPVDKKEPRKHKGQHTREELEHWRKMRADEKEKALSGELKGQIPDELVGGSFLFEKGKSAILIKGILGQRMDGQRTRSKRVPKRETDIQKRVRQKAGRARPHAEMLFGKLNKHWPSLTKLRQELDGVIDKQLKRKYKTDRLFRKAVRRKFDKLRKKLWKSVRRDKELLDAFKKAGIYFDRFKETGTPYVLYTKDGKYYRIQLNIDHIIPLSFKPHASIDPSNFRLTTAKENQNWLRRIEMEAEFVKLKEAADADNLSIDETKKVPPSAADYEKAKTKIDATEEDSI